MLVASLILGISSLVFIFVPGFGTISFVPATVGLILATYELLRPINVRRPRRGKSIAITIFNWLVLITIFIYWIIK